MMMEESEAKHAWQSCRRVGTVRCLTKAGTPSSGMNEYYC